MKKAQNLLLWNCRPGQVPDDLPTGIVTFGPAFLDANLPTEVLMLLPSTEGSSGLLRAVGEAPQILRGRGIGLFLSDPFLNTPQICAMLHRLDVSWVTNLPTLAQHDDEFLREIGDVGFSVARETEALAVYRADGFRTLAVVSSTAHCAAILAHPADAVLVIPNTRALQVSYPSLPQREATVKDIRGNLTAAGLDIPVFPLVTASEKLLSGTRAIERPVPLETGIQDRQVIDGL